MIPRVPTGVSRRSAPSPPVGPGPRAVAGQGRPRPVGRHAEQAPVPSCRAGVDSTSRRRARAGRSRQRALAAGAALAALVAFRAMTALAASGGPPRAFTITVRPGETLWQLSARFAPSEDPRRWIFDVEKWNGLAHATVYPGEVLRLRPPCATPTCAAGQGWMRGRWSGDPPLHRRVGRP